MYNLGGLAVQNLLLSVNKMNVTIMFLKPSLGLEVMDVAYETVNLVGRTSDIVIGMVPLQAAFLSHLFKQTIPYEYSAAKWFVPCPQPVSRKEKFLNTYQLPVWLAMATALVLTAIVWWGLANWQHSSF